MGDAVDRGPAGRYQRVIKEKRRVYREYRLGGERCARVGRHYVPVRKELYFASSSVGAYKFTGIDSSSQPSMDEMKHGGDTFADGAGASGNRGSGIPVSPNGGDHRFHR